MAMTKEELIKEAEALGIKVPPKAKVAEIKDLIANESKAIAEVAEIEEEEVTDEQVEELEKEEAAELEEPKLAKAGKRSAKALDEVAEKQAKEERKASGEAPEKPKIPVKPSRSRLERRGKLFRKSAEQIDQTKTYKMAEAVALAKTTSHVKFDATVELHINLDVDPKHADQNIRDTIVLPAGSGKNLKVAVLTEDADAAKKAGADVAGLENILAELEKGNIDFDVLIATPALMSKLGKYARILGPRGLMPNPKSGTVTTDVAKATAEAKAGRVEYRVDTTGIVHLGIGKVSFSEKQLGDNLDAVMKSVKSNKPASVKGSYIKAIHLSTSMGPSINVDISEAS